MTLPSNPLLAARHKQKTYRLRRHRDMLDELIAELEAQGL